MGDCLSLQSNMTLVKRSEFCAYPESWPVPRVQGQGLCDVQRKGKSSAAKRAFTFHICSPSSVRFESGLLVTPDVSVSSFLAPKAQRCWVAN